MKKILSIILVIVYFFTAQLTVHAFSMHGGGLEIHHSDDHLQEESHCGDMTHEKDEQDHNMTLCLKQSLGVLTEYVPYDNSNNSEHKPRQIYNLFSTAIIESGYLLMSHDPGGEKDHSFSKFLEIHYGSIVMHC